MNRYCEMTRPPQVYWSHRFAVICALAVVVTGCTSGAETDQSATTVVSSTSPSAVTSVTSTAAPAVSPATRLSASSTAAPATSIVPVASSVPVPTFIDERGFDDHTVPRISSIEEFMALARSDRAGQSVVKFAFTNPASDTGPVSLYDSAFYGLHDEWYYFRLLNGQPVEGAEDRPWTGRTFKTVDEIKAWANAMPPDQLPVGLKISKDRLYSNAFYNGAVFTEPRRFGVGSIVRFIPSTPGAEIRWLLELEFVDRTSPQWVATVMRRVSASLPQDVAAKLEWVVRSPQQDLVATEMTERKLEFHDRIVRYSELIKPGTTAVYSEGIAAGRLRYIGEDDEDRDMSSVQPGDIVITEHVPDWLPPANAFITSDPQTPLAHVNLLARNRGIPNLSRAGIHMDLGIRRAADVRAYALVVAQGQTAKVALISAEQYRDWVSFREKPVSAVSPINEASLPLIVDLTKLANDDDVTTAVLDRWRPIIGGKSAGFLSLLSTPELTPPVNPMAITVRPYIEHVKPLRRAISAAIADKAFLASPQARWLVLEGPKDYSKQFPSDADAAFAKTFLETHRRGSPLGDVLAEGGVREMIEKRPVAPKTLSALTAELTNAYGDHHVEAGLRFRSSSSVEDIEGFNGAGLYTSFTGYLQPELLDDEKDHDKTIERALVRAWSSYWGFEAFEERQLEKIDHLSGAMGLTVHARFDDSLERNNGVATLTYLPGEDPQDVDVEINVQVGATPVTNPDPTVTELPEVIHVRRTRGKVTIERVSRSTLSKDAHIMDDRAAMEVFAQTNAVATRWRDRLNAGKPASLKSQVTVLDYEFKTVNEGWPRLVEGKKPYPARLVIRQVRSLDPGTRQLPANIRALPIRQDVLMRASNIEQVRCLGNNGAVQFIEVLTDPLRQPDMGYSTTPFVIGDRPPIDEDCQRKSLYSSPDQYLLELLDEPDVFIVSG
jgi:hypothetical protein